MIIDRETFKEKIIKPLFPEHPEIIAPKSALWIPEENKLICKWFLNAKPVNVSKNSETKKSYWKWCNQNLKGHTRCFMSNPEEQTEWWGFTEQIDIPLWILKWQ